MTDERQVAQGRVNVITTRSTNEVLKELEAEAGKPKAKQYKPHPDVPQEKGRTQVATVTTKTVDDKNKKEAEAETANNYEDDTKSPYYGKDPREAEHKKHPPRTTQQALTDVEKREEEGEKETKKRADASKKADEEAAKKAKQKAREAELAKMTAKPDGTFDPPGHEPTTLDELKKTKPPTPDFPEGKSVTVGGKKYTYTRGSWRLPT